MSARARHEARRDRRGLAAALVVFGLAWAFTGHPAALLAALASAAWLSVALDDAQGEERDR